jgi:hypothetical protein
MLVLHFILLFIKFFIILRHKDVITSLFVDLILTLCLITMIGILSLENEWKPLLYLFLVSLPMIFVVNFKLYTIDISSYNYFEEISYYEFYYRVERAIYRFQLKNKKIMEKPEKKINLSSISTPNANECVSNMASTDRSVHKLLK